MELLHLKCQDFSLNKEKSFNDSALLLLNQAFQDLRLDEKLTGSTTACVGVFESLSLSTHIRLHLLNVGDSGALIIRNNQIFSTTKSQVHPDGAPYQLGVIGKKYRHVWGEGSDQPHQGSSSVVDLERGDLVLFASDGFLDNIRSGRRLLQNVITPVLNQFPSGTRDSQTQVQLIQTLTKYALMEALKGDKIDDITVVGVSVL